MKALKSPVKAVRRIISVLCPNVDDPGIGAEQLFPRQRKAAVSDIFPYANAAQGRKNPLKVKW